MLQAIPSHEVYRRRRIVGLLVMLLILGIGGGILFPFRARPMADLAHQSVPTAPALANPATSAPPPGNQPGGQSIAIAPPSQQSPAPSITGTEYDYVWNALPPPTTIPPDLQARLANEIAQMIKAGHLAPLPLIGGIGFASGSYPWDLGGAKFSPYTLAWLNPADAVTALSLAYPLLPADQQAALRAYLRAELDSYPIDTFEIGGAYTAAKPSEGSPYYQGARRERFTLPPDLTYNLWPPLHPPIDNLYGLWAYASATGDWEYVQGRWATIVALYNASVARGAPDSYGQIGGLIGFARIARQLGHQPEAQAAADLAVRGLKAGADFAAFARTADNRRPNSHATSYAVFTYLTPEVGAYLRDHSRDAVAAYVADATSTANLPTWYLAWGEQTLGGENAFLSPDVAWQLFLAKAYVLNDSETNLRRYLDQPWAVGDPYFIEKIVATVRASASPPPTSASSTGKAAYTPLSAKSAPPHVATFADNRAAFPNEQPPVAERYEATLRIEGGVWSNGAIPYDAHPPPGVPGETGISVDALFSNDGWKTTLTQPAFLYQDYTRSEMSGREILTPRGAPVWKVRFAFPSAGMWHLRITARDGAGSSQYPAYTGDIAITAAPAASHGFVHVSAADRRYFVYDDGTTFNPAGYNESFDHARFTLDADAKLAQWQGSGLNLLRLWMSSSNLVGSSWPPWRSLTLPYDGYLPTTSLVADHPDGNTPFTFRLDGGNRCIAYGVGDSAALAIQPGHTYRLTARVQTENVAADAGSGFTIQLANMLDASCGTAPVAKPLLPPITGSVPWQTVTTTFTLPAGMDPLPYLTLTLTGASGAAYVSSVSLRDVTDESGADLITRSPATLLGGFNLAAAWQWDYVLDKMQAQDITAKIVLLEKNDWAFNHLDPNGRPVTDAAQGNTNFYAAPNTAVRAYEEYYWRTVLARWGAYRSVQSWELLNEGDPASPDHAALAGDFARFMHASDIAHHPVTTSFWAGFPLGLIQSAGLDYADIHLYETASAPRQLWQIPAPATLDANPADTENGHGHSVRLIAGVDGNGEKASIAVHGKGKWTIRVDIRAEDLIGSCPYGASPDLAGPQLLWRLDTGAYAGSEDRGTGIVPAAPSGQPFVCSAPAGTYSWQTVTGGFTLDDDVAHTLFVSFRTQFATSGTAWFDNLTITAPNGQRVPLFGDGTFDDATSPTDDLALSTIALGDRYGAFSPAGAGIPLMRGETGLSSSQPSLEDPRLVRDKDGVWLHTLLWSQLAPGGATSLPWYTGSIKANALWRLFTPYQAFLATIPLAAGGYQDAGATSSATSIRVVGQKNPVTNRAHLWITNRAETWQQALAGTPPASQSGTVTMQLAPGAYRVEWWDTTTGTVTHRDTVSAPDGTVTLTLPQPLATDIAVQVMPA